MRPGKLIESEAVLKADTMWIHVVRDMVNSGEMAKLGGSTFMVYMALKSHTNFLTGKCFPGIKLITDKTGLSKSQVMRCLKKLEECEYININKDGKKNSYTFREKVNISDSDGVPQALATWDYIPNSFKEAMGELKNTVITGKLVNGKIVHIENLTVNIFNHESAQVNIDSRTKILEKEKIRENIIALKEIVNKKKE